MVQEQKTNLARRLAPEEIRTGQYVAVLSYVSEFLPWYCEIDRMAHPSPQQLKWLPWEESMPLKVQGVCLPFVFVKSPRGELRMLDVRRFQLAKLDRRFGEQSYKRYRKAAKKGRSGQPRSCGPANDPT